MWVGGVSDVFSERRFKDRIRFLSVLFAISFGFIVLRLFYLQVMRGDDFALVSESNRTNTIFLGAPRGNFFDRKMNKLVTNRPSWSLMYSVPGESKLAYRDVSERIRPFLAPFAKPWEKRLHRAFQSKQLVRLVEDVPSRIAFGMREMGELLPGLRTEMEFRRDYPSGVHAIQLLGYLGEIDEQELREDYWFARKPGDLIGKMGLEKILDSRIRGQDGGMLIEVDSIGRLKRVIRELRYQKGSSVQLTLDVDLQRLTENAFTYTSTKRGAAVALDIRTGAILAWASAPSFDPSESLAEDVMNPDLPFFDRVYKGSYPPGSLYKLVTAIAGFEKKVIRTTDKITCIGHVMLRDRRRKKRRYGCWRKHGKVDYWKAVSESCDSYFYLMSEKIGPQAIYEVSRKFGLGEAVQSTLPHENLGNIPNPAWKRKQGLGGWSTGDTYNMAIGQGFVTTTPLQMTVLMAGLATKGKIYKPYMIERVFDEDGSHVFSAQPTLLKSVELDESIWTKIHMATKLVVDKGTGKACRIPYLDVHGKTGTAQNPHGKDHAWFFAFAGYKNEEPQLAVCVFVENGGNGGSVAAPIARQMIRHALPKKPKEEPIS